MTDDELQKAVGSTWLAEHTDKPLSTKDVGDQTLTYRRVVIVTHKLVDEKPAKRRAKTATAKADPPVTVQQTQEELQTATADPAAPKRKRKEKFP